MQWENAQEKRGGNELGDWGDELEAGPAGWKERFTAEVQRAQRFRSKSTMDRDLTAMTQGREEKCFVQRTLRVFLVSLWEISTAENMRALSLRREI